MAQLRQKRLQQLPPLLHVQLDDLLDLLDGRDVGAELLPVRDKTCLGCLRAQLHCIHAEAQLLGGGRVLAELQVTHFGDPSRLDLLLGGRVGLHLEHLREQVVTEGVGRHVLFGERARSHLDVHQARALDAVREILHLQNDAPARRLLHVDQLRQELPNAVVGFDQRLVACALRRRRELHQRALFRSAEVGNVAGDHGFAQLIVIDLDLRVLIHRHPLSRAQLLDHPRMQLDLVE
mmetsp:Transcript_56473/g.126097  ORF Transcript_56473/g.126097 Transcript_56473/m.126097 type:complete len:235 (-) Transcript_56473:1549-2253(-)